MLPPLDPKRSAPPNLPDRQGSHPALPLEVSGCDAGTDLDDEPDAAAVVEDLDFGGVFGAHNLGGEELDVGGGLRGTRCR